MWRGGGEGAGAGRESSGSKAVVFLPTNRLSKGKKPWGSGKNHILCRQGVDSEEAEVVWGNRSGNKPGAGTEECRHLYFQSNLGRHKSFYNQIDLQIPNLLWCWVVSPTTEIQVRSCEGRKPVSQRQSSARDSKSLPPQQRQLVLSLSKAECTTETREVPRTTTLNCL